MSNWNPVTIATAIREASDRLEKSAKVIAESYEGYLKAKRAYTLGLATHRQQADGSYNDRSDRALSACAELWLAQDTADVAYKYARDLAEALEKRLSGLQTEAKLIMQAYNTAGVGER